MKKLLVAAPLAILGLLGLLLLGLMVGVLGGSAPTQTAVADIPANYLRLYRAAADTCPGLPWPVLAGIGKVESDHGRSLAPGVTSGANFAGAAGPMQIGIGGKAGNSWGVYGLDANGDGSASPYDPADAIYAAAKYLCAHGGGSPSGLSQAIFAYNHADWYVTKVLGIASSYATAVAAPASGAAGAAVQFATGQLGLPYQWGATGEGGFYDCSGLTLRAYQAAGIQLPRTAAAQWYAGAHVDNPADLQPGDLIFYANDLADPATIHHVGIYVGGGNMIDAPHAGAVVRVEPALRGDYIGAVRPSVQPGQTIQSTQTTQSGQSGSTQQPSRTNQTSKTKPTSPATPDSRPGKP